MAIRAIRALFTSKKRAGPYMKGTGKSMGWGLVDFVIALLADIIQGGKAVRSAASARNMFKNLGNGAMRPRRKRLLGFGIAISSESKCVSMTGDCTPYFLRIALMGANPNVATTSERGCRFTDERNSAKSAGRLHIVNIQNSYTRLRNAGWKSNP